MRNKIAYTKTSIPSTEVNASCVVKYEKASSIMNFWNLEGTLLQMFSASKFIVSTENLSRNYTCFVKQKIFTLRVFFFFFFVV